MTFLSDSYTKLKKIGYKNKEGNIYKLVYLVKGINNEQGYQFDKVWISKEEFA